MSNQQFDSIEDLDTKFLVPLDNTVEYFESLFLITATNEEDADKIKNLDEEEIEAAKSDLVQAITPHIDQFFYKITSFITLPVSRPAFEIKRSLMGMIKGYHGSNTVAFPNPGFE